MKKEDITFSLSTWKKARKFQEGLKGLESEIPMPALREYLSTGEKKEDISDDIYAKIDELQEIRKSGIQTEMVHAVIQAKRSGIELTQEIMDGDDLRPCFSDKVIDKVPSLHVYSHFMLYTEKELKKFRELLENGPKDKTENDSAGEIEFE